MFIGNIDRPITMPSWYSRPDDCSCHEDPEYCINCRPYLIEEKNENKPKGY